MQVELTFEGEFPTLNEVIDMSKSHFGAYKDSKEVYTNAVITECIKYPRPPQFTEPVDVHFLWYRSSRRSDPDNIAAGQKFILDGLVKGGVLKNDGWKQVKSISHDFEVDKHNPRVVVTLTEVESD